MRNKNELEKILELNDVDICLIQETLLPKKHQRTMKGYRFIGEERKLGGGGVAILIKNKLRYRKLEYRNVLTNSSIEIVGIEVIHMDFRLKFISIYIPPDSPNDELMYMNEINAECCVIGGDFNSHNKIWSNAKENTRGKNLQGWITSKNLKILNDRKKPTYFGKNGYSSTPDIVLISSNNTIGSANTAILDFIGSDHLPIYFKINFKNNKGIEHHKKTIFM